MPSRLRALTGMTCAKPKCRVSVSISGRSWSLATRSILVSTQEDRAVELADEAEEELVFAGPVGALVLGGCASVDPGPRIGTWGTRIVSRFRRLFQLHAARGVHQHQHQVAGFQGFVDLLQHAAVEMRAGLVDAGRIDKDDLRRRMHALARRNLDHSGDAVAGGLRLGGDNGHFFAGEGVEQRAFAGVGPAENGDKSGFQRGNAPD